MIKSTALRRTLVTVLTATALGATGLLTAGTAEAVDGSQIVNGGSGKCLDVRNGGTADGTPVQLYTCNGTASQRWVIFTSPDGSYDRLYNRQSKKCLDVSNSGTSLGTPVQIWTCNGSGAQTWGFTTRGLLNLNSNQVLDVPLSNFSDGQSLQIWEWNGSGGQQWSGGEQQPETPAGCTPGSLIRGCIER
ncbi:RICIN domain-containing protein [Kitasatospora sp. NPDC008050]|uniref:RICIN domain-containing protein n=1 Tax=Kitasatospora sp. NPDC008050 TaxID=3364021 RepID=UPI0036EDD3C6